MHRKPGGLGRYCAAFALAVLAGCGDPREDNAPSQHGLVTFAPNITETVFALGQGDRIIGVTKYCDYPPEARDKQSVGDYLDPDLEKITLLAPELIILAGQHEKLADLARQNHIPILHAHMDDLATIQDSILRIGAALGCDEEARKLWTGIQSGLESVRAAVKGLPRPRVLVINTRTSHDLNTLFTIGRSSFVSELLEIAGGVNIFEDQETPYFEASKETVVLREPEVIIEFHAGENLSAEELQRFVDDWNALPTIPAVANGRVLMVTESYGLRPGPRVALIAAQLARLLHPEADIPAL